MPSRTIVDGILTSERVNRLSIGAELFYRRLLNVVDDYGRYYANSTLLLAACYPLRLHEVTTTDIEGYLKECLCVTDTYGKGGLLRTYTVGTTEYLEVVEFKNKPRAQKSKFPPPQTSCEQPANILHATCEQPANILQTTCEHSACNPTTFADKMPVVTVTVTETVTETGVDVSASAATPPSHFCKRNGKKTPADLYHGCVLLTRDEYCRMVEDWGEGFTKTAIADYANRYPNSPAIRKHTDHNRGIRDYVNRGFICSGKTPHPKTEPEKQRRQPEVEREELGTPEERTAILRETLPPTIRVKSGLQPVGDILAGMQCGP